MALIWGLLFLGAFWTVVVRWWVALESGAGSAGLDIRNGWLMQLGVNAAWVGPEAHWACQPRDLDVVSPHGYSLPSEVASFQRDSQEEVALSQHCEAQEEATASYNPTSEVLECRFLLLLVKRVIKAQPGFTGRELESTS